jgi:ribonuclease-3
LSSFLSRLFKKFRKRGSEKKIAELFSEDRIWELESLMGCKINNKNYFVQALVHRSYLEDNEVLTISNERLEFLGDSVLNLVAAEYMFKYFPEKDEGFLTKIRAKVVNRIALADAAENIKLGDFILISKNLSQSFVNGAKTVLSDAYEALVGAIYLDSGIDAAKNFINKTLIEKIIKDGELLIDENFKSQLLEYAQANKMDIPVYSVVTEEGPQHNRTFTVKVLIGGIEFGLGTGKNKKSAEQNAAKAAMGKILNLDS